MTLVIMCAFLCLCYILVPFLVEYSFMLLLLVTTDIDYSILVVIGM